ncbi:MAG: hypothetical protein K2X81_23705 [Candidatus Obscuribacterales bacterium]|nr:hypothetical protein [Candidatus Obscuribacterales bacterium]
MSNLSTKRAQESANALRLESLKHFSDMPKANEVLPTSSEVSGILGGFALVIDGNRCENFEYELAEAV